MSGRPTENHPRDHGAPAIKGAAQVSNLASRVISLLRQKASPDRPSVSEHIVEKLLLAASDPAGFDPEATMDMLRRAQLSDQEILETYIPEAARRLGCFWNESVMSFAQVTIVAARLQLMVREVEIDHPRKNARADAGSELSILVVVCENEMHTLGCVTLAASLRNSGHSVRQLVGATQSDFRKVVKQDWYDLILFSCARKQSLEFVSSLVIYARTNLRTAPPLIIGGAVLAEISDAAERTGVDLATNDLQLALKLGDTRCLDKNLVAE